MIKQQKVRGITKSGDVRLSLNSSIMFAKPTVAPRRLAASQRIAAISLDVDPGVTKPFNIPESRLGAHGASACEGGPSAAKVIYILLQDPADPRKSWQNKTIALIIGGQMSSSSGSRS